MRQYEITYLISDDVAESEINKVSGKVNGYIADAKGKVLKEESWGRRKLAYPIQKQQFATYITLNFELEPENLREIEKDIMHAPEILRHLTIVRTFGKEELTLTAEDIAETEDIEEVVGGEKSFEAIEGETEESRDLMAVRGESEEDVEAEVETEEAPVTEEKIEEKEEEPTKAEVEEVKEKKASKPRAKKTEKEVPKVEETEEVKTEKVEETPKEEKKAEPSFAKATDDKKKPVSKAKVKTKAIKDDNVEDEADRLAKLDKELDDILGDDL